MTDRSVEGLVAAMTLEEKASLCSGANNADTKAVPHLGIPSVKMHDGPNGLRREDEAGEGAGAAGYTSVPATCMPSGCALGSSWDVDLMDRLGRLLAEECHAVRLPILLGPSINIKRTPLNGRNFEYLAEDPFLAGKLAAAYIRGLQAEGIGAGLKHFAANNQECRRLSVDAVVDERALREIYLTGFEIAVRESQPWTVMCAYNSLNGEFCCENHWLLTRVLREEWGFEGFVMSDWGAVNDRVRSLAAGLELQMPSNGPEDDQAIVEAVRGGALPEEVVDEAVRRLLTVILKADGSRRRSGRYDTLGHHAEARAISSECIVLLKNDDDLLPLSRRGTLAVIGGFAQAPRFQGGGSAHVRPTMVDSPLDEIRAYVGDAGFAPGYVVGDSRPDRRLIGEAVALASTSDTAVVFVGLYDEMESEGLDRESLAMPASHVALVEAVAKANPRTIVVLMVGSPVEMEWAEQVGAVVLPYLGGQAVGGAVADVLFGKANPSGHLAESFPTRLAHNPAHLFYDDVDRVEYREGVFVGYRYYDTKDLPVRYCFGHGLSYTTFAYSPLRINAPRITEDETLDVVVPVQNVGEVTGAEVVQLYVRDPNAQLRRPDKELKAFTKITLEPGERREVTFTLDRRSFAYFDPRVGDWYVAGGDVGILVGRSSRDIRQRATVTVDPVRPFVLSVTMNTTVKDVIAVPARAAALDAFLTEHRGESLDAYLNPTVGSEPSPPETLRSMSLNATLRQLLRLSNGAVSEAAVREFVERLNRAGNHEAPQ